MFKKTDKKTEGIKRKGVSYFTLSASLVVTLLIGFLAGTRVNDFYLSDTSLTPLKETYKALKSNYDGKLDDQKLIEGASRGMVEAAGDPYTVFFNKKEASEFAKDLGGKFSGIGAEIGKKDGNLVVITTLDNNPAQKAGLLANDIITKVNGEATTGWSVDKIVSKIRGEKGTTVKLTVSRDDQIIDFDITRDSITDPSVKTEEKGDIGIIRISRFGDDTASLARKAAEKFQDKKGIVVDLRGNGGGYLESAQEIASIWLNDGQIVVTERTGGQVTQTHKASGDNILKGKPTVVLVDEGSASASEILAGALQDNNAAKVVGVQSFGKGSVQTVVDLRNGAQLKVTVARWYTPNGKNIGKKGITPDVIVVAGKNDDKDNDTQLNKALDIIK
ncbi:MAG: S41 family peptidase [Candidatus Saccharibacteria bacterium]|nr:S41 family peptidase [Candidatus Saccharibacteria bacterium]